MLISPVIPPPGHTVGFTDPYGDALPYQIPDPMHVRKEFTMTLLTPAFHNRQARPPYPVTHDTIAIPQNDRL